MLRLASASVIFLFVLSPIAYATAQESFGLQHNPQAGATTPQPKQTNAPGSASSDQASEPLYCITIGGLWDDVSTCTFSGSYTLSSTTSSGTLEITSGTTLVISNSGSETYGITVDSGATLTVDSGGAVTIENSGTDSGGILVYGTLTNSGTITTENAGMEAYGIYNYPGGTFTSSGTITIENSGTDSDGIINDITFTNSGTVTIENTAGTAYGIWNNGGSASFTNYGTVTIENSGGTGIYNYDGAAIINECDSIITVENTGGIGISDEGTSTITNNGGTITGYSGTVIQGTGCTTSTTTSTSTSTTVRPPPPPPPGEEQVGITLNQFEEYGSPLSASNYFTVSYTQGGASETASETGGLLTITADSSTTVNISATTSGSNIFEEWCLSIAAGTCGPTVISVGTSAVSETYVYFDLQAQTINYGVSGGGNPVAPTLEYSTAPSSPTSSDEATPATVNPIPLIGGTPSDVEIWSIAGTVDVFSSVIYTNPASGSEEWQGVPSCSYLGSSIGCGSYVSDGEVGPFSNGGIEITIEYYNDYAIYFSYEVIGSGTGYTAPTLTYDTGYGIESTLELTTSSQEVYAYAGSIWSVPATLEGSGSSEQWACTFQCSGTVSSADQDVIITAQYTNEFLVTFEAAGYYGCSGSGYPPLSSTNTCIDFGPNISPYGPTWVPAGEPFTVSTDVTKGSAFIGWTTCASFNAINDLPGDSGCPASDISIPSGLGTETGNGWETEITASGPGTVYADLVFQASGSTSPCTGPNCSYVIGTSVGYAGASDPVYILVTGPGGVGQVGCNAQGIAIDTMALASVSSCGGDTESITIANPLVGRYEVQLFPDGGTGAFILTGTSEDSGGNAIGTPLSTSGTCTVSGGCGPFYVSESGAGTLSFSSVAPPPAPPSTGAEICQGQASGQCFTSFIAFNVTSGGIAVDANVIIVRTDGPTQVGTTEVNGQLSTYDVSILDTISYTVTLPNGHILTGTVSNSNPWTLKIVQIVV